MPSPAAISARVVRDDVAIVGQADPHRTAVGVGGAAALGAILMCDETIAIAAKTAIKLVVVEQEGPSGGAGINHDVAFERYRVSPAISNSGDESTGAEPSAARVSVLPEIDARFASLGRGRITPSLAKRELLESVGFAWPCETAAPPFGLVSGIQRSPPFMRNQPSAVHSGPSDGKPSTIQSSG